MGNPPESAVAQANLQKDCCVPVSFIGDVTCTVRGCYRQQMDGSNGYEAVSEEFLAHRGNPTTWIAGIGVKQVQRCARTLPRGSSVIDLGCGPGYPITTILVNEGLHVFGVDAAPSFVAAFQRNLPGTPVICEAVQESRLFDRTFEAALAWELMFFSRLKNSIA